MSYFDYDKYNLGGNEYRPDLIDYDHAKDHLIGLLEDIYKTGCISNLEFHLEEICGYFGLKIPRSQPKLQKREMGQKPQKSWTQTDEMLKGWVNLVQDYANQVVNH